MDDAAELAQIRRSSKTKITTAMSAIIGSRVEQLYDPLQGILAEWESRTRNDWDPYAFTLNDFYKLREILEFLDELRQLNSQS